MGRAGALLTSPTSDCSPRDWSRRQVSNYSKLGFEFFSCFCVSVLFLSWGPSCILPLAVRREVGPCCLSGMRATWTLGTALLQDPHFSFCGRLQVSAYFGPWSLSLGLAFHFLVFFTAKFLRFAKSVTTHPSTFQFPKYISDVYLPFGFLYFLC